MGNKPGGVDGGYRSGSPAPRRHHEIRGSSVLRMNERCEPQRQVSMSDSARQGWLSGVFHEALIIPSFPLVQGIKALQIRTLEAWTLVLGIGLRDRSQDMIVLVRSTASQTTFSGMVRNIITGGLACRLWNGVTGRGLVPKGREIISFIRTMRLEYRWDKASTFRVGRLVELGHRAMSRMANNGHAGLL